MKRVFDDEILEGSQKAFDRSIEELEEMKANYESWHDNDAQINSSEHAATANYKTNITSGYFDKMISLQQHNKKELQRIYNEVYEAETAHVYRMQEWGLRTDLHNNALEVILESLGPADGSGVCYSWKTVSENLLTAGARLSEANVATMFDYYFTTGRWREVLGKPWENISEDEYHMLALIYLNLETPEEIQEFACLLCEQIGPDGSYGYSRRWEMNQEKLERIQGYVGLEISDLSKLYESVNDLSLEDFKAWYKAVYGEDITDDDLMKKKTAYLQEIDGILWTVEQKQTLLLALSNLEYFTPEREFSQTIFRGTQDDWRLFEQGALPGTSAAVKNEPPITITWDEEYSCYELTYKYITVENGLPNSQTLYIGRAKDSSLAVNELKETNQAYWNSVFGSNDPASGAIDKANSAKDAGLRAIGNILNKAGAPLLKKIAGRLVPIVGPVTTTIYETSKDNYEQELRAVETDRLEGLFNEAGLCVQFGLVFTTIHSKEGRALSQVYLYEGPETQTRIDNYNFWVEWWNKRLDNDRSLQDHVDKINAVGKITIDDIYTRPEAIAELYKSGDRDKKISPGPMTPREAKEIFSSTPLTEDKLNKLREEGVIQ